MIASDIITRVRRTFGDEAAVQVTDEDVLRWINDGQIEVIKHNDAALQKTNFLDIVQGQSTYALPADLMILRSLRYKYGDMTSFLNLRYKNMQQFDETIDGWDGTTVGESRPSIFTKYEGNVILFPTPDGSGVAGLKVLYNQTPATVDDVADGLALPIIYHNTLMKYCLWQASLMDEDHEPALMYHSDFQSDMGMLQNRETQDVAATYQTITVTEFDS